jgi:chromosome segregation ATPase
MERAAIFFLAELERAKGGGLILKQPEEKLAFIVEGIYPFWLVPWKKRNLLFDGLGKTSHTFAYTPIPDAKSFMEDAERSSKDLETYISFLSENLNYFQQPSAKKETVLSGLIADASILSEFSSRISEAKELETPLTDMLYLSPTINESSISSMTLEIENVKTALKDEVELLYKSMKFLNKQTQDFIKELNGQIKATKEEFNKQIMELEGVTKSKVKKINEEFDEKTKKLAKEFEKKILPMQREKVKLEKAKEQMQDKIERYKIDAKTCAAKKDAMGEKRWKEKIAQGKREISEIEKQIKNVEKEIEKLEENRSEETFKLKSEWEAKVSEAKKDLLELEATRDAKIGIFKQKIENLESLTSAITEKIDKTAKARTSNLNEIENLGIEQKQRTMTLVYVPFYLACYQFELKNRYVLFPPSAANSIGLTAKIKGALGMAKIKQLLTPRFEALTAFLGRIPSLIGQNPAFEREVFEVGDKFNILKRSAIREKIGTALKQFMEEGWLSEKDYENFIQKLA